MDGWTDGQLDSWAGWESLTRGRWGCCDVGRDVREIFPAHLGWRDRFSKKEAVGL